MLKTLFLFLIPFLALADQIDYTASPVRLRPLFPRYFIPGRRTNHPMEP